MTEEEKYSGAKIFSESQSFNIISALYVFYYCGLSTAMITLLHDPQTQYSSSSSSSPSLAQQPFVSPGLPQDF
jgi:hypothetical protein